MTRARKFATMSMAVLALFLAACTSSTSAPATAPSSTAAGATTTATTPSPPSQDVDSVHFFTPKVGWATVDNASRLLMTTDGGARWRDVSPPMLLRANFTLASGPTAGSFLSQSDFWVSVYDSLPDKVLSVFLLHTTDGGQSWSLAGSFPNGAGAAWESFLNERQGWVELDNGEAAGSGSVTVYETTNGGQHWSVVSHSPSLTGTPGTPESPGSCDPTGISVSGTSRAPVLWLSGASNLAPCLSCSTDGGRRWSGCGSPSDPSKGWGGEAWPPVFSSESSGALRVSYGTSHGSVTAVYSTSNGGKTWKEHRPPSSNLGPVDVVSSSTCFDATSTRLYRTTNGGITWSSISTPHDLSTSTLDFVTTMDGWAILSSGRLWHTTDGGRTWALEPLPR